MLQCYKTSNNSPFLFVFLFNNHIRLWILHLRWDFSSSPASDCEQITPMLPIVICPFNTYFEYGLTQVNTAQLHVGYDADR